MTDAAPNNSAKDCEGSCTPEKDRFNNLVKQCERLSAEAYITALMLQSAVTLLIERGVFTEEEINLQYAQILKTHELNQLYKRSPEL